MDKLAEYLQYPFVRYALIVGVLIALCSSLLGVPLVLKRFSFIGDGLSHVAFGAMCIATVLKLSNNMLLIMPVTIIGAVLILRTGTNTKIKGDAIIAMISVFAPQGRKVERMMVIRRSFSFSMVRAAMIAGTPQPVPMSIGMKDLPDSPKRRNTRSMMNATRAIYPESSRMESRRNSRTI